MAAAQLIIHELLWLGIAPCVTTFCPPDITRHHCICDEISQAFSPHICNQIVEAAKTWEQGSRDNCSQVLSFIVMNLFNFRVCNYEGVLRDVRVPGCQGVCNSDWAISESGRYTV